MDPAGRRHLFLRQHEVRRFTELQRGVTGISQRMLTATVRGLERDGLLTRTVHPVVPQLMSWVDEHVDDIEEARAAYDDRAG